MTDDPTPQTATADQVLTDDPSTPSDWLTFMSIAAPKILDAINVKWSAVNAAVAEHGKAGSLTITLSVKPTPNAEGMVTPVAKLEAKIPEADQPGIGAFFVRKGGRLADYPEGQTRLFDPDRYVQAAQRADQTGGPA